MVVGGCGRDIGGGVSRGDKSADGGRIVTGLAEDRLLSFRLLK